MKTILFLNHGHSNKCGVYAQGIRHFENLKESKIYNFLYFDVINFTEVYNLCNIYNPEAIMYNYMPVVMNWLNYNIKTLKTKNICVIHNITQKLVDNNQYNDGYFDNYISLDRSLIVDNNKLFSQDRPIYKYNSNVSVINNPIKIGTFGFPFLHKGFDEVIKTTNNEFEAAEINLHMSESFFCNNETEKIVEMCLSNITKPNIKLNFTNHFIEEKQIIDFLNKNDINCLFYHNLDGVGVSAAIDYMISAQKPILISTSQQFRNFHNELPVYPFQNLTYIVEHYAEQLQIVKNIYNRCLTLLESTHNILNKIL